MTSEPESLHCDGALIIGAGVAGLFAALKLAPAPCMVISPEPLGRGASSAWAQGGVAAALDPADSAEAHAADTVRAGAGLVDPAVAAAATAEAPARVEDLARLGAPFARAPDGAYLLSKEAAHSAARVARFAEGDGAGRAIMAALTAAVARTPSIRILEGVLIEALTLQEARAEASPPSRVIGAWGRRIDSGAPVRLVAEATLLAAGGLAGLYAQTTNPGRIRGQALGMAARAGALIRDAEFVQFHPTAIAVGGDPAPLATEALRGEGAVLIDGAGERFMLEEHEAAELAPRDVVARAVFRRARSGDGAFLDTRAAIGAAIDHEFPSVAAAVRAAGLDPLAEPIPVTTAAHYHMGGVAADLNGRSSLPGLWVCGEAAATGLHGANRLASNGLLESFVFAARAAADIAKAASMRAEAARARAGDGVEETLGAAAQEALTQELRSVMSRCCGVERDRAGLEEGLAEIARLERLGAASISFLNMTAAATIVVAAAWLRDESRGGHFRRDHPAPDPEQAVSRSLTYAEALAVRARFDPEA
ncbi:MAG: L-aspartate oxidase [Pseudomonadota bacterium]